MINEIHAVLAGDATLTGLLSGGVHKGTVVHEVSRQNTPGAFDANREILPCALVQQESLVPTSPFEPYQDGARLYVLVHLYQRFGYEEIEAARKRAYALLHRTRFNSADGTKCWRIEHSNDLLGMEDMGLNCAMEVSRYVAVIERAR